MALKIVNSQQLNNFLVKKPVQWSHLVSVRALLRALPLTLNAIDRRRWLPSFRTYFICWAAGRIPTRDFSVNVEHVSYLEVDPSAMYAARVVAASSVLDAANFSARVVDFVASVFVNSAPIHQKYDVLSIFWNSVENDLVFLSNNESINLYAELALFSLWRPDVPDFIEGRSQGIAWDDELAIDYSMWINWYQSLLTGNGPSADYFGPDLTLRIAQQPDEWWDRPAAEVNADIAAWLVQRDEVRIDIPEPEPGTSMGIASDGRIGVVPTGVSSSDERSQFEGLLEVLGEKADELVESLAGSNAFADLLKVIRKYAEVVRQQTLSIDRLYARGNILENTRAHLQKDIDAGNLPDMPLGVAAGLDSILSMHGSLIASTQVGQQLLDSSHIYESKAADISVSRSAAREFANAVARSDRLFTDEVREEWPVMADSIGTGPYPERSTQVAMVGNKNLMIALAILVATPVVESAVTASIPGALAVGSLKGTIDAAWLFMVSYLPVITNLVQVSGPSLAWMKPVLRLISRGRG